MRKGTFSVQKTKSNSANHNSRKTAPKYLIELENNSQNYYELIQDDNDFIFEAQQIYKDKINQSMQKKQIANLVQETVLTLTKNQDENDVKKLFKKLHQKFGGHELLEVSIHRDEGYFLKDDIAYYLTKNMIKKENEYFMKSDVESKIFDKKVDIKTFEKVYNYHAHAKFSMFDKELGKTARMQKRDMSNRIKFVSEELGLEFAPDSKTSRIKKSVNQVKNEHFSKAKEQQKYNFREMQKEITGLKEISSEQKKELHHLNSQVKNNKIEFHELKKAVNLHKQNYKDLYEIAEKHIDKRESIINKLRKENSNLKEITIDLTIPKVSTFDNYQQKLFYDEYKSNINDYIKDYFIDKKEDSTTFKSSKKGIEVKDFGNNIKALKSDDLESTVKLMLEIAKAKNWDINKLNISGNQEFKQETAKQISEMNQNKLTNERETILKLKTSIDTLNEEKTILKQSMKQLESINQKVKSNNTELREFIDNVNEHFQVDSLEKLKDSINLKFGNDADQDHEKHQSIISKYKDLEELKENLPELFEEIANPNFSNKYEITRLNLNDSETNNNQDNDDFEMHM